MSPAARVVNPGDGPFIDIGMLAADGNVNWDDYIYDGEFVNGGFAGAYLYASFSTSTLTHAAQYSYRYWWRDFGDGGFWDIRAIHTTGFDVGIYSFRIDGREVGRFDGYSGPDINNTETTVATRVPIPPGFHKLSVHVDSHNPACTGLPWYPAIQGILLRKTAPLSGQASYGNPSGAIPNVGHRVINVFPCFASGNTNWDNILVSGPDTQMANGYELYSTGAQNAARWWDLYLGAGTWTLDLMVATFSSAGIISVQVDGVTVGTIDTYSASTLYGVRKTLTFPVLAPGLHTLKLLMATKNGSASNYYGDVSNLQLRQGAGKAWPGHRQYHFTTFWSHGDDHWHTVGADGSAAYGGEMQSDGTQGASRWWYVYLEAGTWSFDYLFTVADNRAISSVRLDDAEVGTIDGYFHLTSRNQRATISGIAVARTGVHKLSIVAATKNPSSSNYYAVGSAVALRRTG